MTRTFEYDLLTIGAGSGGVRASRFAAKCYNARVAVVELPVSADSSNAGGGAGGTSINRGCFPKKLLMYGTQLSEALIAAPNVGWDLDTENASLQWGRLMQQKDKEVSRVRQIYCDVLRNNGVELIEGRASMQDAHTVVVHAADGKLLRTLTAANIVLATGSKPKRLDIPGAELAITSDEAMCLPEAPKRVAIVGAGCVGTEFAGIWAGAGASVHLIHHDELPLPGLDTECRHMVNNNLLETATVHANATPSKIERNADDSLRITFTTAKGAAQELDVDQVLMAIGRSPSTSALSLQVSKHDRAFAAQQTKNVADDVVNLQKARVAVDEEGFVKVSNTLRTNVPHIWAVGDVAGRVNGAHSGLHTPVALMEGMAVAHFALAKKPDEVQAALDYSNIPTAVFCQPPVATVGLTEAECIANYVGAFDVYIAKFKTMRNTLAGRDQRTLIKLIVHADSDRVVGCHHVGPDAPEIMQGIAIALKAGATKAHFDSTLGVHPTAAEEMVSMRNKARTVVGEGFKQFAAAP